jgi:hypothetical protein
MTNEIVDLGARREDKAAEMTALRAHVDSLLDCDAILADAIEQMWEFAERSEILRTLRRAIDVLEGHD